MNSNFIAIFLLGDRKGVIKISCVEWINCEYSFFPQILTFCYFFGLYLVLSFLVHSREEFGQIFLDYFWIVFSIFNVVGSEQS